MLDAVSVARYFIKLDTTNTLFNKNLIQRNGRSFYEGNARLNKYLHIAQNLYLVKTGTSLFKDNMYAYDNGAVVPSVQESYSVLLKRASEMDSMIPRETEIFLNRVYAFLRNASLDELIEISHEDPAWEEKHLYYAKEDQCMNSYAHLEEYREQYKDALRIMESMTL